MRLLVLLLLVIGVAGCGTNRIPVSGTVQVDGTPLEKGYIILMPLPETKGPTAGADIVEGAYQIDQTKGVFEGDFRVEIKGWRDSESKYEDSITGEVFAEPEQFLPEKFNKETELTVKVTSDQKEYNFDLELD